MTSYKIKKYYLKKTYSPSVKKKYIIKAKIFKYKFGFLVDIFNEKLDSDYKCNFETKEPVRQSQIFYKTINTQIPKSKKKVKTILQQLNNNL